MSIRTSATTRTTTMMQISKTKPFNSMRKQEVSSIQIAARTLKESPRTSKVHNFKARTQDSHSILLHSWAKMRLFRGTDMLLYRSRTEITSLSRITQSGSRKLMIFYLQRSLQTKRRKASSRVSIILSQIFKWRGRSLTKTRLL